MNKKVLTLCAGVLLVGGSAIFTVNAMNASNEKVQSTYVATKATGAVAGYELEKANDAVSADVWSLVKTGEKYYLSPATGYFLASDGSIKSIETSTIEAVKLLSSTGAVSFDGKNAFERDGQPLFLWEDGTKVTTLDGKEDLSLATSKKENAILSNETVIAAFDGSNTSLVINAKGDNEATNKNWKLADDGTLTVSTATFGKYYNDGLAVVYDPSTPGFEKVSVAYEDNQLKLVKLEGTERVVTPLWFDNNTLVAAEEQPENAKPAVLFDQDGNVVTEEIDADAEYFLGVGEQKDVIDEAYIATPISAIDGEGVPGTEYGIIPGVQYQEDGTLNIIETNGVTNAEVPVIISRKNATNTEYLGIKDGKTVWGSAQETWVLSDGVLRSLNAEKAGNTVYYAGLNTQVETSESKAASVVFGGNNSTFAGATYTVAAQSLMAAPSENSCDNPLLAGKNDDYVYIGGEVSGDVYYFKADGTLTSNISEAELWRVNQGNKTGNYYDYTFTSRTNTNNFLKIGSETHFQGNAYATGIMLRTDGGNVELNVSGTAVEDSSNPATVLGFYRSETESFSAEWLIHRYGSSFQLNITEDYNDKYVKEWHGNVFADADLVPVVAVGPTNYLVEITDDRATISQYGDEESFLLKDRNSGLYLALRLNEPWTNVVVDLAGHKGYKFELLSEENVRTVLNSAAHEVNGVPYMPYFRINYLKGKTECDQTTGETIVKDNTEGFCIEVGQDDDTFTYDVIILQAGDTNNYDLYVTVNDRCENDSRKPTIKFASDNDNIVRGEDNKNNPLLLKYVNIKFKAGDKMQFENEAGKMVNLDGKVLGINAKNNEAVPTEAEYFLFDKAEGQWAVSMTEASGLTAANTNGQAVSDSRKFTFTNRENPEITYKVKSMHYLGNNTYAVEYESNDAFGEYNVKTPWGTTVDLNKANRDTLVITEADVNKKIATDALGLHNMDSYANWTKEELQDKTFQLSIDAAAQLYVTENEGKDSHFLGLTDEVAYVTNWRLVPFTAARVHDKDAVKYLTQGTDSVYIMAHPQYYSGGKFYAYNDTTAIITYALQNIQNNEWLTYDPSQNQTIESMICDPNSKNFTTANLDEAYRFVLKEKAEGAQKIESGAYNIIGVNAWEYANNGKSKYVEDAENAHYSLNLDNKLYGATTYQKSGAIEVKGAYEDPTSNDIFTIATTASQEYVKATPRDTVRIFGAEENDFLLYEKGQFLNMGNKAGIAPAMVLDTAYYSRTGNNRYQYLIVVNPDYKPEVPCDIEGHPALHPDTMYGRFLVNKIDSAVLASRSHNNPYINDIEADEKELKLGFQWGYRTGDKLYLTAGKGGKVIEIINLGTPDFNKAKFAFKYVNEAVDKQFKVQTAWYDYDSAVKAGLDNKDAWTWNNEGYLRSVNGVIVVTNGYTHGEEFLMAQENSDPTANESINASSVVVAGVDGAVVVKGAEGKNVIVSTILGKVVANETVSSDNATIAAPQGVVVVSVDGESFKVVVK